MRREPDGTWYKQVEGCNQCGECCKRVPKHWWLGINEKGWCKYLRQHDDGYMCMADTPFGCMTGDYAGKDWCSVKWQRL